MSAPCWATSWGQRQQGDREDWEGVPPLLTPPRAYHRGELCSCPSSTAGNGGSSGISSSRGSTEGPPGSSCETSPGMYWLGMKGLEGQRMV